MAIKATEISADFQPYNETEADICPFCRSKMSECGTKIVAVEGDTPETEVVTFTQTGKCRKIALAWALPNDTKPDTKEG